MKGIIQIAVNLSLLLAARPCAAESLSIHVDVQKTKATSESIPFKVIFTNDSDMTVSVLKPIVGRNMVVCVCDERGDQLARSAIPSDFASDYGNVTNLGHVSLAPRSCLETETYELFSVVYPGFRITPGQVVRMDISYLLEGKEYKADAQIRIPPHDFEIRPEYISKERARALAALELKKRGCRMDAVNDVEPKVQCINGTYRVVYARKDSEMSTIRGGGEVCVRIDAITGNVLQLSMGRR